MKQLLHPFDWEQNLQIIQILLMKKSHRPLAFLLLVSLAIFGIDSGRILSGDIAMDYANAGEMTQLSFSFMLQNSISADDYIKVSLPFPLHSQLVPAYPATEGLSLPSGLVLTYQQMDNSANILPTVLYGQILTETIDSSNYFIRFYDTDRKTFVPIPKDQWYYITFDIEETDPLQYQKSNSILQIQMSTVSSVWSNAMVYDDNLAFNYFELASTPSQNINLTVTPYNFGNAGGYLLTQKQYSLNMDVSMSISDHHFTENLVLKFLISEKDSFLWSGTCSSVAKTNAPVIAALNASLYTCEIDTTENIMKVTLQPEALALQTSYRFTADIVNPSIVVKDVDVVVRAVKEESPIIVGFGQHTAALSTNQIYVTYQEIFIGWGLRPDALLPFDARVFRGNAATPTYMPYNSLSLKFSVSQTTSTSTELKLIIDIPSESGAFVLESGYTTNLPAATDKVVKCVTEFAGTGTSRRIGCTGVGSLVVGTVYEVGWKMFFPYDNYESAIDCTSFGTLTIYTTKMITKQDNTFFLGRGDDFLSYLKASPEFNVLGRNASYIDYMKTFLNLNLVVLSQDFQEFLQEPEEIFITNRPYSYANKQFNDVYVIRQNLAFMTYISLFDDIYIAAKLKSDTDIVKDYDSYPLMAKSTPKNTLTITTSNSKDWQDFTDGNPVVSSTTAASGIVPGTGLKVLSGVSNDQSLIFGLKAPYAEVSSFSSTPGTSITDNWGMMIMMNPKITFDAASTATLSESSASLSSVTVETESSPSAYNQYSLITLRGSQSDNLLTTFPVTATKTHFGVHPFKIEEFSSIYADSDNMDIMIATVDGIDGPLNKIKYNGFFLINSFTMMDVAIGTLNYGFVNVASTNPMDGSKVPMMLRVKGTVADNTNFDSLSVFFDKLTPFHSNYYTGDIFCHSTDGTSFCKYHPGHQTSPVVENYQTMSRIDIPIATPASEFNVLVPITFENGQTSTKLYIGYQKKDPVTGVKTMEYIEALRDISITRSISSSGSYGPEVSTATVGSTISNMVLKANSGGNVGTNSGDNLGAAFSYFSEWDYIGTSTVTGWESLGFCLKMSYLFYYSNYDAYLTGSAFSSDYKSMKGIVCFCETSGTVTSAELVVASAKLPSKWGKTLPGYGAISQNTGHLYYLDSNYQTVGVDLEISGAITFPPAGPLLIKSVGQFVIPLEASLDGNTEIRIVGQSGTTNIPYLSNTDGSCSIFYGGLNTGIDCAYISSPTELEYTLTINEEGLLPAGGSFSIVHYGLTTNSSYSTVNVDITVSSLLNNLSPTANDLIFKKNTVSFAWEGANYIGQSALTMNMFSQWTSNKATVEDFEFTFSLISKGLDAKNRVRFDLGHFAIDNAASAVSPTCKVYDYDEANGSPEFSHDWSAVDSSQGLTKLEIWPKNIMVSNNLTYVIKCKNFISTSSPTPTPITAKIVYESADLTGSLTSTTPIALPVLTSASTSGQISVTKSYTIPSTVMEMLFTIVSPGITEDSILYLNFPSYFSNGLGPDIKCYQTYEIYCEVTDRQLMVRYLGAFEAGTTFTLTVAGVSKSINYNSGTFSFIVDSDDDPTVILTSGTFVDSVKSTAVSVQSFPTFPILSLSQSSAYLREEDVSISADFYLPTTLPSIVVGQSLLMVFPPIYFDVLRFVTPSCVLNIRGNTLKNYISSCSVRGLRLKMVFLDDIILGSTYSLTVSGLINPTNPSSNVQRYSFEVSNSGDSNIVAKSYTPDCNYRMPIFSVNPVRKSLNYYTVSDGLITNLVTMKNIQSQDVFISTSTDLTTSSYERNAYLEPLNNLYTIPSTIQLSAGANPFPIRFTALTSGVNYVYFQKTGDGSFYSNLPPLILTTNKNYFTPVTFLETSFDLPVDLVGTNYTLSVTLPESLYPISEVNMTATLSDTSVGLSLRVNPTVVQFYPTKVTAYVNLFINDATAWVVGATTNLILTPAGTTYASSATIPLNAVAAASGSPTLTVATNTINKKDAGFDMTCSQHGRIMYHVSRYFAYNTSACSMTAESIKSWSQQSSIDSLRVSETYYDCQDQIVVQNVVTPGSPLTVTVENLQASLPYTIEAFCESQANVQSSLQTTNFDTVSNGGVVSQVTFYFATELTTTQKIKLVCALALYFSLDYERVSTWDGYYCSELLNRRLLLQASEAQESDSQIRRESSASLNPRVLSSTDHPATVFFGVNNDLLTDNTQATIAADTASGMTALKDQINTNVTGLPELYSYSTDSTSYIGSNSISNSDYRIDIGPNYVFVEGLQLQNNGLIYILIGDSSVWTRDPLVSEIKKGSGPNGLSPAHFRILSYKTSDPSSSYMAWNGLGDGTYTMYIMVTDDNPFDTASVGSSVTTFTITKELPKWGRHLLMSLGLLSVLLVLS